MGVYQLGTAVTITETFSLFGVPTSPTTVTFVVRDPNGTETTYVSGDPEITNPSPGVFVLALPALNVPGVWLYTVAGAGAVIATGSGEFTILQSALSPVDTDQPQPGPCTPWVDCGDIQAVCSIPDADTAVLTGMAMAASQLLFQLSGQQFTGLCQQTVRPFNDSCGCWPWIVWPASPGVPQMPVGYGFGWGIWGGSWGWGWTGTEVLGTCGPVSRVLLPGYPVTSVVEVEIDGVVIDPSGYRLDGWQYLTRLQDPVTGEPRFWPSCQNVSAPLGEPGTWGVTCTTGQVPPVLGQKAAAQLGCELFLQLSGADCKLPQGVTQVQRQGLSFQLEPFRAWGQINGQWATGLYAVDAFLSAYNSAGLRRPSTVWSPDDDPFALRLGTGAGV